MDNIMVEKNKCFVSTVVYIHNRNAAQLEYFCDKIIRHIYDNFENNEVIFVCDADNIINCDIINDVLTRLKLDIMATTINMAGYHGIEACMCAGMDLSIGDFVFEFDSIDVDYEVELVMKAFEHTGDGFDIVSVGDDNMKLSSRMFYQVLKHNRLNNIKHETFRIVSRRAINRIKLLNNTITYRKALYAQCGLPSDHIEYKPVGDNTPVKNNKKEKIYRINAAIDYFMIFTNIIEKISYFLSGLFLMVTIGVGAWAIYNYFAGEDVVSGWVSLIGVMSFGFFGVFIMISIIIKYMALILNANYKKSTYVVESVNKNLK